MKGKTGMITVIFKLSVPEVEMHDCHECTTTHDREDMIQCTACLEYFCTNCACDCFPTFEELDGPVRSDQVLLDLFHDLP
jgi:hypothetical protein